MKNLEWLLLRRAFYSGLEWGGPLKVVDGTPESDLRPLERLRWEVLLGHLANAPFLPSSLVKGCQANMLIWRGRGRFIRPQST